MIDDAVVLERTFAAPVARLWEVWTDPTHFAAWYGPKGASIPVAEIDLRVGGLRRVCMEMPTPDGPMRMWFAGEFREIVEGELLVYTEYVADEDGTPLAATAPDDGPAVVEGDPGVTEVRVAFQAVEGGTRVRLTHLGIPSGSPGEMGWTMAFDSLDRLLATSST